MTRDGFRIRFEGEGLAQGRMDVRDLAPALLSVGQLFDAANEALNGDAAKVNIEVQATETACFDVALQCVQSLYDQVVGLLNGEDVSAAANLVTLVTAGGGAYGLIGLVKKLQGGNPDTVTDLDDGTVKLTKNNISFIVPFKSWTLYQNMPVREAISSFADIVNRPEIESAEWCRDDGKTEPVLISKSEARYFAAPEPLEEVIVDDTHTAAYSIVSLAFKEDNKWRLHDGNNTISATIEHEEFIKKVNENEIAFAKGDVLICKVNVRQTRDKKGLHTEHKVLEVLEHKSAQPAAQQLSLL